MELQDCPRQPQGGKRNWLLAFPPPAHHDKLTFDTDHNIVLDIGVQNG
jgi:hypothetical protein